MALNGGVYCSPVSIHERRSWWLEFVRAGSVVVSLNKLAGGSCFIGLAACLVLLCHHGGGEDEETVVG
jgi:hypothetical protein